MQFKVSSSIVLNQKTQCLVLVVDNQKRLSGLAAEVDSACDGLVSALLKQGDLPSKAGATLLLHNVSNLNAKRLLLVSSGSTKPTMNAPNFEKLSSCLMSALSTIGAKDCVISATQLDIEERDQRWVARTLACSAIQAEYRFDTHKSNQSGAKKVVDKITLHVADRTSAKIVERGLAEGQALAAGLATARDLGNLAPNVCTPTYLANYATTLRKSYSSLKVSVLEEAQMKKHGMGALLSVSAGSAEPAKLITMQYNGGKTSQKPVVLVGKGITFDTGGISLKPGAGMDEMKFDMCGAASVFGVMRAVAELKLAINVIGVVAAAENMPSGTATRPGDVVTSMSGQTIEILNTDAEGRLVLCDALTWVARHKPDVVIDIATLTGACIIALGNDVSALMSNDDHLSADLFKAGMLSSDKCWRLPIWDEYQALLKSNFADLPNIAGRAAGSITAGCFLSQFAKDYRWAHLDIAGVAWKQGGQKGATGRPVPLLLQYLLDRSS